MKSAHDLVASAKSNIREVSVDQADGALKAADLVIDVREADEYQAGHIPGAVNIPRGLLEFKLDTDPTLNARNLKLVVYCKTSGRAALSAQSLKEMGYLDVSSIAGGFDAWAEAGKPVDKPKLPTFE